MFWAVEGNHANTVDVLLEAEADVNATTRKGQSSLMYAVFLGHTEIAEALLEAGADVNLRDEGEPYGIAGSGDPGQCSGWEPNRGWGKCQRRE